MLTKQEITTVGIGTLALGAIAVAGIYGRSFSRTTGSSSLDPNVTSKVLDAAVAMHSDNTQVAIERIKDSASTLATLKGYEEQVRLGTLAYETSIAQFASDQRIAGINAARDTTIAQASADSAAKIAGIQASAATTQAQAAAGAEKTTSFWNNIGSIIGTVGGFFKHI
jgi:hypothetical protein